MTIFAKIVAVVLCVIGTIAVIVGVSDAARPGTDPTGMMEVFSGLMIVAVALGLYMLAIIAREPERRHRQEVKALGV